MDRPVKREKDVTVVIPNYNGIQYLDLCIQSILRGTMVPKIIVVDNGSDDGSRELLSKYPEVLVYPLSTNTGFCHAVNCGLHLVRSRYAILLNNDVKVEKTFVERLYTTIAQSAKTFSVQAKMLSMKDPSVLDDAGDLYSILGYARARGKAKPADTYEKREEIFSTCAGAAIYRMAGFEKIGYFDERHYCYLEDVDIGYRAQIFGYRNLYEPKAVCYHAGSATSGSRYNAFKESLASGNSSYLAWKNMPAFQYVINLLFLALGRAMKQHYFTKKGLGEAFSDGLERGKALIYVAKDQDWLVKYGYFYKKRSLPEEALLEGADEELQQVMPLYLGTKVPFSMEHLPSYVRIQGKLWSNLFRELKDGQ